MRRGTLPPGAAGAVRGRLLWPGGLAAAHRVPLNHEGPPACPGGAEPRTFWELPSLFAGLLRASACSARKLRAALLGRHCPLQRLPCSCLLGGRPGALLALHALSRNAASSLHAQLVWRDALYDWLPPELQPAPHNLAVIKDGKVGWGTSRQVEQPARWLAGRGGVAPKGLRGWCSRREGAHLAWVSTYAWHSSWHPVLSRHCIIPSPSPPPGIF